MSKITCEVDYTEGYDENGHERDCVETTCGKCGHKVLIWGHDTNSVKRSFATLSEECPAGENNFYTEE